MLDRRVASTAALLAVSLLFAGCGSAPDPATRDPIVLIVVDTLRADHLGLYGYSRDTSPQLERLAARGAVFEHAYATSPWTLPTFGSLLTGLYPSAHGAGVAVDAAVAEERAETAGGRRFLKLSGAAVTAAEALDDAGYATAAFVSNPFLGRDFGLDRGFEHYDRYVTDNADHRRADRAVDEALAWIDGIAGRPFFLLLHFFEPHLDYDAPEPFRGRYTETVDFDGSLPVDDLWGIRARAGELSDGEKQFITAAYDEEIAFVDAQIGRFADAVRQRGLDRTLLVVTSDHGEELFEHAGFEHGHAVWDELLRIPLVVVGPGVSVGRRATPVSAIDVLPTILGFAAVAPAVELPGLDLRAPTVGGGAATRDLLAERTLYGPERQVLIRWPRKLIIEPSGVRLFDLSKDPFEATDLGGTNREVAREMVAELARRLDAMSAAAGLSEAQLDPETRRRLRALGYLR